MEQRLAMMEARLQRLEQQNRWLKRVLAGAAASVLAFVILFGLQRYSNAAPPLVQQEIRTKKLLIVDAKNNVRAELSYFDAVGTGLPGPSFSALHLNGKDPGLGPPSSYPHVSVYAADNGTTSITLDDGSGKMRQFQP